jgi:hypothetical protein
MSAEEKELEKKKAGHPKLKWLIIAVVIIAIVIGVVVYYATQKVTIHLVYSTETLKPLTGFTSIGSISTKTISIPQYVDKVKIILSWEDEEGAMWPGAPGDDILSLKIIGPDGEVIFSEMRVVPPIVFERKIGKRPPPEKTEAFELFTVGIERKIQELFPSERWKAEVRVCVPVWQQEDPGNSWTINVEYSYWEPKRG